MAMIAEVPVEGLRRLCDPQKLGHDTSESMKPLEIIIGQERAVRSLQFGLGIKELGFNIYVTGAPGTGKATAVKRFLEAMAKDKPVPRDWCYVNNFRDLYRPNCLALPPGRAREFQTDMLNLKVCQAEGLTQEQGVIIPKSNVTNLMLKEEVVEAVKERRFHIWGVQTIDEGIEILTGMKAGEKMETGTFEEGTV